MNSQAPHQAVPAGVQPVNVATVGQSEKVGVHEVKRLLNGKIKAIQRMIPKGVQLTAEGLIHNALLQMELARDNRIKQCTPKSILYSVMAAASVGLDLMGDQAYLIPMEKTRWDKEQGVYVSDYYYSTLWPDYKGLCTVAARFGWFLDSQIVRADDQIAIDVGANTVQHPVGFGPRGDLVGVYCAVRQIATGKIFHIEHMNRQEIDAMRKDTDPWRYHYNRMAMKCPARRAFKWVPKDRHDARMIDTIENRNDENKELDEQMLGQGVELV